MYYMAISGPFKGEVFIMVDKAIAKCRDGTPMLMCINDGIRLSYNTMFGTVGKGEHDFVQISTKQLAQALQDSVSSFNRN